MLSWDNARDPIVPWGHLWNQKAFTDWTYGLQIRTETCPVTNFTFAIIQRLTPNLHLIRVPFLQWCHWLTGWAWSFHLQLFSCSSRRDEFSETWVWTFCVLTVIRCRKIQVTAAHPHTCVVLSYKSHKTFDGKIATSYTIIETLTWIFLCAFFCTPRKGLHWADPWNNNRTDRKWCKKDTDNMWKNCNNINCMNTVLAVVWMHHWHAVCFLVGYDIIR